MRSNFQLLNFTKLGTQIRQIPLNSFTDKLVTTRCVMIVRSNRPEVFCKKVVLRNFIKLTENTCARVSFLSLATLLKKRP